MRKNGCGDMFAGKGWRMRTRQWLCCVAATLAGALILPAAEPASMDVKLTCESMQTPVCFTPGRVVGTQRGFRVQGNSGEVSTGDSQIMVCAVVNGTTRMMGIDQNGDGRIDAREMVKLNPGAEGSAPFLAKVASPGSQKPERVLMFSGVVLYGSPAVASFTGTCAPGVFYKGNVNGTVIRVYDDSCDGKITQNGKDAIFIGPSDCAQPLGRFHQIGNVLYEMKVSDDAASVTLTKEADTATGQVRCPLQGVAGLKSLVLTDAASGRAYDLVSAKALPAGDYRLSYGVISGGKDTIAIKPPPAKTAPVYTIKADSMNTLRLGPTIRIQFQAKYSQSTNELEVMPSMKIMGIGNEAYDLDGTAGLGQPSVTVLEGNKVIAKSTMEYG